MLFAAGTVAIRRAFTTLPDPALCAAIGTTIAFLVTLIAAVLAQEGAVSVRELWPFAVAGLLAPGASQIFFTAAVHAAGPSRVSVVVGTAPLFAVGIAIALLGEPIEVGVILGALLIVGGGLALVGETTKPADFRAIGVLLALCSTVLFATRDNVVRWLDQTSGVHPLSAAAVALFAGASLTVAYRLVIDGVPSMPLVRRGVRAFGIAGMFSGLSYICLFEAFARGRVTVVNPLVATESLWGVVLSVVVFRRSELVGRRLLAGALLVVAGGALIGATQ